MDLEDVIRILTIFCGIVLSVVNVSVQTLKRTINKWAKELIEIGVIESKSSSEIGTVYSNPFTNWFLEISSEHRFQVLRNQRLRDKLKEYKELKKTRNILILIFLLLLGLFFYLKLK